MVSNENAFNLQIIFLENMYIASKEVKIRSGIAVIRTDNENLGTKPLHSDG